MGKKDKRSSFISSDDDKARPVTGTEATMDEATLGSAGNGAFLFGADFTGGLPQPLEQEPDAPDLQTDHVFVGDNQTAERWDDANEAITAQPSEKPEFSDSDDPLDES